MATAALAEARAIISARSSAEINFESATLGIATGRQQGRDLRSCSRPRVLIDTRSNDTKKSGMATNDLRELMSDLNKGEIERDKGWERERD